MTWNDFLAGLSVPVLVLFIMSAAIGIMVTVWHLDKSSDLHLQQCIVDNTSGKLSIEKVGYMTVLAFMSWGFVALVLNHKLTEWYAGLYVGAFVLARFGSSWLTIKKALKSGSEPPTPRPGRTRKTPGADEL